MRNRCIIISIILLCIFFAACKEDGKPVIFKISEVVVEASYTDAYISGTYEFNDTPKDMKILLGKKDNMTEADIFDVDVSVDSFNVKLLDLDSDTKYYYCFECHTSHSSIRSDIYSFVTLQTSNPVVVTDSVSDVTQSTALCGGDVKQEGSSVVTARGVCWSTTQDPTVDDNHTTDGEGLGEFISNITGLAAGVTYYVRAYAINNDGLSYGNVASFTTKALPVVVTKEVGDVTDEGAMVVGEVTSDGGEDVTERGVCWSINQNPTTADSHIVKGSGEGTFTSHLTELQSSTTYYVRAYATNIIGTQYGSQVAFTTLKEATLPTVTTDDIHDIEEVTAVSGGNVVDNGGAEVTSRGVCWSTSPNPTTNDHRTIDGTGTGSFVSLLTSLELNTTYYLRAYATNKKGTNYGEELSFTTKDVEPEDISGDIDGYFYVDLGLPSGLKWATRNIGASSPEEYGNYYAWGETETKEEYTRENCATLGVELSDISGNPQYDAASANWGGTWRLPSLTEMKELVDYCEWIKTTRNGINGYKVVGPNGHHIFLPAAGLYIDSLIYNDDDNYDSEYWTSTPDIMKYDDYWSAISLSLRNESGVVKVNIVEGAREYGKPIRPVSY